MPLLATTTFAAAARSIPITEAVSGIFGSISLTSWICLLVRPSSRVPVACAWATLTLLQLPQLFTNYKAKSADGLSMAFLVVWLLGDITNLVGS